LQRGTLREIFNLEIVDSIWDMNLKVGSHLPNYN